MKSEEEIESSSEDEVSESALIQVTQKVSFLTSIQSQRMLYVSGFVNIVEITLSAL